MGDAYFDIDLVKEEEKEPTEKETCFERVHRWANYDPILFLGCFALTSFLFIMMIFVIVWAIYNK